MFVDELFEEIKEFSKETHGSSNYYSDEIFVMGHDFENFAPLKYLQKKFEKITGVESLLKQGFAFESYDFTFSKNFSDWYERQFSRKLVKDIVKKTKIVYFPDNKVIFDALAKVNASYEILRNEKILLNGKNMPTQLGEWYAKCIFGLQQLKSTSQRGFDFYFDDNRVEVNIDWGDQTSPKGVKVKKTLLELSKYCIVIYVARNLMIREICLLDSDFVLRKFSLKGHTIFLKDSDISTYFFGKSDKHLSKVRNPTALLTFASPAFAMKMAGHFSQST